MTKYFKKFFLEESTNVYKDITTNIVYTKLYTRLAYAIFKEKEYKQSKRKGLYNVHCIDIVPLECFKQVQRNYKTYQYKPYLMESSFVLRKHKNILYNDSYFDVQHPGRDYCEGFIEITEDDYHNLKKNCKNQKIFIHNFYQNDPSKPGSNEFYHYQREAIAVFETVKMYKKNVYEVKCFDIIPVYEFEYCGVGGGIKYQYKIGSEFKLRQHKKPEPVFKKINNYFDVQHPGRDYCEGFVEITENEYKELKNKPIKKYK